MSTVRKSLDELSVSKKRLKELSGKAEESIDYSDIPELDADFFEHADLVYPPGKQSVTIRLDSDVLAWMKAQGKGYQSRINAVLRAYYEAHRHD
ncbi:3-oxoacyl-ACP synthase [Parahaliea maris]|uniref:3-oxoacyl-ACP synthase n=1 Tax=Parahaliea maris TaxID=2716870 RepID=A0A5C8ZR48_9GAMM|nr:BrnA antitoxin family protein [Parahaliea maris]TXS90825.1 3-oxoacyl-ACP synthase [Parahaliea maris]